MKRSVNKTKSSRVSEELRYYSTGFDFKICLRTRKVTGSFEKRAPVLLHNVSANSHLDFEFVSVTIRRYSRRLRRLIQLLF